MAAPILNANDLQYLGEVRLKAPADAPHLVRFFTDLADWADNEFFLYMGKHGAEVQQLVCAVLSRHVAG